jgi:hypothetical protein
VAQLIVVVQILVTQRNAEDALANQRADLMLDQLRAAVVGEAGSKPINPPGPSLPAAANPRPTLSCPHRTLPPRRDPQQVQIQTASGYTLSASGNTSASEKVLLAKELSPIRNPDAPAKPQ